MKKLKKILFDLENRKFEINGEKIEHNTYEIKLTFKAGLWSLDINSHIPTSLEEKTEHYSSSVFEYCKGKENI